MTMLGRHVGEETVGANERVTRERADVRQREPVFSHTEQRFTRGALVSEAERVGLDHDPLESIGLDDLQQCIVGHDLLGRGAIEILDLEDRCADAQAYQRQDDPPASAHADEPDASLHPCAPPTAPTRSKACSVHVERGRRPLTERAAQIRRRDPNTCLRPAPPSPSCRGDGL